MSVSPEPLTFLRQRDYLILFIVGLMVALVIVSIQPVPGYMDADYYYAGGMQLASGHGFTDPFLWNYLDHPLGLPHPSNSYWYPLASIVAAGGMVLTGKINFLSARIGFVLMAALAPLIIAALAYRVTRKRSLALLAGFLAIFSGYYLPFIVTTDNYSLYMLVGALFFSMLDRSTFPKSIFLGLLAGALNLARGDGILWLPLAFLAVTVLSWRQSSAGSLRTRILHSVSNGFLVILGYLLVMGAWFVRNLIVFRALMPPGTGYVLWMTDYNQTFSFTPEMYTFQSWLASGLQEALKVRISAVWQNLGTAFFAEGMIFLCPLIIAGVWKSRHLLWVQLGVVGWLAMLLAESLLFPFASVRGGFFHAGTAFQPVWFALAPLGLEALFAPLTRNNKKFRKIDKLFPVLLLVIMIPFSAMLVKIRVLDSGWNEGEYLYQKANQFLVGQGARPDAIVMVRNPPAYFIMTGRQAIVVPDGDVQMLLAASRKYKASYVILEQIGTTSPLIDLYEHPEKYTEFSTLGVLGDNHILLIKSTP
ncbi:MAG: hypothetical protein WCE68_09730 [Anaerolineales bacterium]